jgi:hypothetical protein
MGITEVLERQATRQALIGSLPAAGTQACELLECAFSVDAGPGLPLAPLRQEVATWAARYSLNHHWFIERLTHAMLNVRSAYRDAEDRRILDPRLQYRIAWITYSDYEDRADDVAAEVDLLRLYRRWRTLPRDAQNTDDGTPAFLASLGFRDRLDEVIARRPLEADPVTQSRKLFLTMAGGHFDARAAAVQSLGIRLRSKPHPDLWKHAEWFVRNHFGGESYRRIAAGLSDRTPHQTVSKAIKTFRNRLQLPTR